jgi:hypothetical protein
MLTKTAIAHEHLIPVAISDKDLSSASSFTIQTFDLCTICGARFRIGYLGPCSHDQIDVAETVELPRRLTEILANDHRRERGHRNVIDLDM